MKAVVDNSEGRVIIYAETGQARVNLRVVDIVGRRFRMAFPCQPYGYRLDVPEPKSNSPRLNGSQTDVRARTGAPEPDADRDNVAHCSGARKHALEHENGTVSTCSRSCPSCSCV